MIHSLFCFLLPVNKMLRSVWRLSPLRLMASARPVTTLPGTATPRDLPDRDVSMQGVQGDVHNDPRFSQWLQNCQRWGLGDCQQKTIELKSGKTTIEQLFKEQEALLKSIAESRDSQADVSEMSFVSPQGIQGEDCERYELWLRNCRQFGFGNCNQQLADVRDGRKTLSEIFAEQDDVIRQAAEQWRQKEPAETQQSSGYVMSSKDRLKRAVKDYGATVIIFHVTISVASLSGFYALVSSGVDVIALLQYLNVSETFIQSTVAAGASTFVIAYAVHKVFAPARMAITLACVPFIVRYLRRINILKTPKPK